MRSILTWRLRIEIIALKTMVKIIIHPMDIGVR